MLSKFGYIKYPFFGTYTVPEIKVDFNKISATVRDSYKTLRTNQELDYLTDALDIEIDKNQSRFKFNVTAKSTQELIMLPRRCVWGVDKTGNIHNLQRNEMFKSINIQPKEVTNNYIWFREVTRPIVAPFSLKNIMEDVYYYWFTFLHIDNVWELYKISPDFDRVSEVWI
jgi:hypothetical protein